MSRMWIVVGDTTTGGGAVVSGTPFTDIDGKPVARVGDKVLCARHGPTVIVTGDVTMNVDGQPVARQGDYCACGCRLMSVQQAHVSIEAGGNGGGDVASAAASAAPALQKTASASIKPVSFVPEQEPGLADYDLFYHYGDLDRTPVRNVSYKATLVDGSARTGNLDDEGRATLAGVPKGPVSVEYQHETPPDDDAAIEQARDGLRNALAAIVAQTRKDYGPDWKEWNSAPTWKRILLTQANMLEGRALGVKDWAVGTVETVVDLAVLFYKADTEVKLLTALILTGEFEQVDKKIAGYRAAGEKVLGVASEVKELLILIYHDQETRNILAAFPQQWLSAIPDDERAELQERFGTQFAVDIAISVLLAAFTAGAGGAAYGGAKWAATVGRLGVKIAKLLDTLEDAFGVVAQALRLRKRAKAVTHQVPKPQSPRPHGATGGGMGGWSNLLIETKWAKPPLRKHADVAGKSEGGPGVWSKSAKRTKGEEYQEQISGVERGTEYRVNAVDFDGYDAKRGVLKDAKDWRGYPPKDTKFWQDKTLKEANRQIDAANGTPIEWHFSTAESAREVKKLFNARNIDITTVVTPKN